MWRIIGLIIGVILILVGLTVYFGAQPNMDISQPHETRNLLDEIAAWVGGALTGIGLTALGLLLAIGCLIAFQSSRE